MTSSTSPIGRNASFSSGTLERNFNGTRKLKCVLVGDISVGKTSLAVRFSQNKFENAYRQTIEASFLTKVVNVNGDMVTFQLWDTAGQERYKSLVPMYLRGAHIALLVYDVTDPASFANLKMWLKLLQHHEVKTVLVGNKSDCTDVVDEQMVLKFAQGNGLPFAKTSAKTGENVDELFLTIGAKVVTELKQNANMNRLDDTIVVSSKEKRRYTKWKNCCKS